jgi:hypothetical protein
VVHVVALCSVGLRMLDLEVNVILRGRVSLLFAIRITSNLSLLSDVFGTGVNRNEIGHNECYTQTMLFRCNHCVLSLWVQLKHTDSKKKNIYIHTHTPIHAHIRISFQVDAYLHVYSNCWRHFDIYFTV